jgi:glycosyltransferase involved in cell wall biosynthesis
MRIVHVVESFAGGVFQFLVNLINGLPNHEHVVIYGKREDTPDDFSRYFSEMIEFYRWENVTRTISIYKDVLASIELYKLLYQIDDFQVIHLHSSKAGFIGRLIAWFGGFANKIVYTPHGVAFARQDISKNKRQLYQYLERFAAKVAGTVVACSLSECYELKRCGINSQSVNNGIQFEEFPLKKCKLNNIIIIGTIGRITFQKNPELFNKMATLFKSRPNVQFLWIGDGELRNVLSSENIDITGWLPQSRVIEKLQSIDIYLSTSLWEGLPLSVLQAMVVGMPLVLFDSIGNRDLVQENENGYIYNGLDAGVNYLNDLVNDVRLREQMARASQISVREKFSLKEMKKGYEKIYKEIAKSN